MDDNRKTRPIFTDQGPSGRSRVVLLVLAGVLLVGAALYGFNELKKRGEEPTTMAGSELPAIAPATKPAPMLPRISPNQKIAAGAAQNTGTAQTPQTARLPQSAPARTPIAQTPAPQPTPGAKPVAPVQPAVNSGTPGPPLATQRAPRTAVSGPAAGFPNAGTAQPALPPNAAAVPLQANAGGQPLLNGTATAPSAQPQALFGFTPKTIPSTSRVAAAADARAIAGRPDPCAPLSNYKPFPTGSPDIEESKGKGSKGKDEKSAEKITPPPPPPGSGSGFVPPPPPGEGLSVAELPAPPAKPSVSSKLKLVAIVGDRAILSFSDVGFARDNKYPKCVTLGPGEQFESMNVVGVNGDSVTLEEDGERSVKTMEPVK